MKKHEIVIRPVTVDDAAALLDIYRYYVEHTAISFEYDVPTVEEFRGRIAHTIETYPYLAAVRDGTIIGYAYAHPFVGRAAYDWSAELTVYIDRDCRHAGAGRALYEALEQALRQMGVLNLYACIGHTEMDDPYLTNNSEQFHAHMGFATVGMFRKCGYKFGHWYDMIWMEKIIGIHGENQPALTPYPAIREVLS